MTAIFDSIIFDMDGTLWDAVDSYCEVWDVTFAQTGRPELKVTREELIKCMGLPIDKIYDRIVTDQSIDRENFLRVLDSNEQSMMPKLGGKLYDGVSHYMPLLAQHYRLFMVSNCGAGGIHNFLELTGLSPCMTDTLTFGQTHLGKDGNINLLREKYRLQAPVYVGDTESDCTAAHKAGIPMIHAAYGFGTAPQAEAHVQSFAELAGLLLSSHTNN